MKDHGEWKRVYVCGLWDQMAIDEFHLVFGTFLVACDSLKRLPKLLSQSKLICT